MKQKVVHILTCKRDPMARDRDETETFDFQSETRSRPRPSHVSTRPRRDRDVWKVRLETETSRPRLHPCCWLWKHDTAQNSTITCTFLGW